MELLPKKLEHNSSSIQASERMLVWKFAFCIVLLNTRYTRLIYHNVHTPISPRTRTQSYQLLLFLVFVLSLGGSHRVDGEGTVELPQNVVNHRRLVNFGQQPLKELQMEKRQNNMYK